MELSQASGKLVAVGGAEDREGDCLILKEFLRLAKGPRARVVVMTVATDEPEKARGEWAAVFKRLGVDQYEVVDVSTREHANDEEALKKIEWATGLYFTGGDQLHVTSLLGGTPMHKLIFERYNKGLVVGGTSAGAAMMSNTMILGGDSETNPRVEGVQMAPGLDLLIGAIVDTHFSQRGRHGRLLTAVAHNPQDIGFGIDEDTAMLVDKTELRVVGAGAVTVFDAGAMTYTNLPYAEKEQGLALFDVKVHVLSDGCRFDLAARRPVDADEKPKGGKSSNNGKQKNKRNQKGEK
ncbi:MAG TPA: cyanophycinase [Pyrinomonadaceae bacterium]|nr:cyanophycinase [Pyrinomonadaceae bacterium]